MHIHVQHGKSLQRVQSQSHQRWQSSSMWWMLGQKVRSSRHNAVRHDGQLVTRFYGVTSWLVPGVEHLCIKLHFIYFSGAEVTLCPSLAFSYIGGVTARHSSSEHEPNFAVWYKEWNYGTFTELFALCRQCWLNWCTMSCVLLMSQLWAKSGRRGSLWRARSHPGFTVHACRPLVQSYQLIRRRHEEVVIFYVFTTNALCVLLSSWQPWFN